MKTPKKPHLSPIQKVIAHLKDEYVFYSATEYDYDRYRPCENGSNCCESDFCRCSIIQNAKVKSINVDYIVKTIIEPIESDNFLCYCVDRIIRASSILDITNWKVNISSGYYGEEINSVSLSNQVLENLISEISKLDGESNINQIKQVLEFEYGYLLPKLKNTTNVNVVEVVLDKVKIGNGEYYAKVSKEVIDYYKDYKLPRAVCLKEGSYFALVDGFHRIISAQKNGISKVSIIEIE